MCPAGVRFIALTLFCLPVLRSQEASTFTNPLFDGQDPWVTNWNGNYYYSESDGGAIRIRKSPTLTGLAQAVPRTVWSPRAAGISGMTNIWAPEVHFENGGWLLYFNADFRTDRKHRLYVLEGGPDPFDPWRPAATGLPNGRLAESRNGWAIDANLFRAADDQLYLTWSCAESDIGAAPQSICLARMADPLHVASQTVRISRPDQPWETRTAAIQEGPTGFARNGITYLTYSGSASWTTNDYAAGLLVNTTGDLLDTQQWRKYGPILDRHGNTFGPASSVFIPSPDGTEIWNVYHAYDQVNCAAWSCRSIRIQKVSWTGITPVLQFPNDPGIDTELPSGDQGSPTGWGSARNGTQASGNWSYRSASEAEIATDDTARSFRGSADLLAWTVTATLQEQRHRPGGQYGIYPLYRDADNYVQAFFDPDRGVFGIRTNLADRPVQISERPLPRGFNPQAAHALRIEKAATGVLSLYLDGALVMQASVPLTFGQIGLFAQAADLRFENIAVHDNSHGWSNPTGTWDITAPDRLNSPEALNSRAAIYRGNPNFSDYSAEVTLLQTTGSGLIACSLDAENEASVWLNEGNIQLKATVHGTPVQETLAYLPVAETDARRPHKLSFTKAGTLFTFYLDDVMAGQRSLDLPNGRSGLVSTGPVARFEGFSLSSEVKGGSATSSNPEHSTPPASQPE